MEQPRVSRRDLLAAGLATGAALTVGTADAAPPPPGHWSRTFAFTGTGEGWPGWACPGVANLRRADGTGRLEAGSDVFPYDPRPVAFALDCRARDAKIAAVVNAGGAGTGVVLRRTGPRDYYAAIYDDEQAALLLVRRSPQGFDELARATARPAGGFHLTLRAAGSNPTVLTATLGGTTITARDAAPALQRAGDPGVLATARTLYPSAGPAALPSLGNVHLLPYGVQEGEAVMAGPVGAALLDQIRERSTAVFTQITVTGTGRRGRTRPSVVAATNGAPHTGGAQLRVATDVPAIVEIELATDPRFRRSRRLSARRTDEFGAVLATAARLAPEKRWYWRPHLRRHGLRTTGPTRSFQLPPRAGSPDHARIAVAACAAQFGPIFGHLSAAQAQVFVWQGDLNYPDTVGPLAQTISGYAGIWRDFLANPQIAPLTNQAMLAVQRDDHDYGVQDANSTNLVPWGLAPWKSLMEDRHHYRFSAGQAEFWVLDQRRFKSDPTAPDNVEKTLLGPQQRDWLLRTLSGSRAPFKVICSPCTVAPLPANGRDGSWATGFTAERELVLDHIHRHVSGQTIFITGDTHWTMAYDRPELFEARPCPLCIPTPNDITLTDPQAAENARSVPGVAYADDEHGHFALVDVEGTGRAAHLDLTLVRDDGQTVYRRRFEAGRRP